MTISQMSDWFDQISDKVGAAYFPNTEKSLFINRAIKDIVREAIDRKSMKADRMGEKDGYEKDDFTSLVLSPLTRIFSAQTNSVGTISLAELKQSLGSEIVKIETVFTSDTTVAKFVRNNEYSSQIKNTYTKPRSLAPYYRLINDSIYITPSTQYTTTIVALVSPREVSIDEEIDCDLPDICHNEIMKKALAYAGIAYRDEFLYGSQTKE